MKFVPQAGQMQPYRRCCYPGARPGPPARPGTPRRIRAAVIAGDRLARNSGFRHRGPGSCSPLCLTATGGRAAARDQARVVAHGTLSGRRRTTALRRLLPSSQRLVPMISGVPHGHARDRRATTRLDRRPGSPGWRDGDRGDVPSYERTSRGRIRPATARGLSREGQ